MISLGRLFKFLRCASGSALVEGAIVLPVAIALMAGGVEFGMIWSVSATADKSMRDAARYLARLPASSVCTSWALINAQSLAVFGKLPASNGGTTGYTALISYWNTSNVQIAQPVATGGSTDCSATLNTTPIIQLTASVPYNGRMLGFIGLSNSMTFSVQHEERWIGE